MEGRRTRLCRRRSRERHRKCTRNWVSARHALSLVCLTDVALLQRERIRPLRQISAEMGLY